MRIWGLHIFDVVIVCVYLLGMLYIGKKIAKSVKGQQDFYLAGRKLGRIIQFFLNFGNMTDANGAASISSVVFRNGIGGIWIGLQTLFMTPYYWFMNVWFRRVRLVTISELFTDRFGGKSLATLYALFAVCMAPLSIGWGYLVSEKVMEAMMVKPAVTYSSEEKLQIKNYAEFKELKQLYKTSALTAEKQERYISLRSLHSKGELKSYVSYINPLVFFIIYGAIVGIYIVLGGFEAAAITDAVQGVLIIVFSFILIPFGLIKLGGFSGLHDTLPSHMFSIFGDVNTSEFTWFSILAILLISWVQIHAVIGNMSIAGSAKDEMAARLGAVTGGFSKRFMLIAWGLCGLIAYGLYSNVISDADTSWGVLSNNLLCTGGIGLMLAGILAANMSTLDAAAVQLSALFVRNLYMPVFKDKSESHYVFVGRIAIVVVLVLGIFVALHATGIISLLKTMLSIGVTFGAPIVLLFFWRGLTKTAVRIEVLICLLVIGVLPWVLPLSNSFAESKRLTIQTHKTEVISNVTATEKDVSEGIADTIGQSIMKKSIKEPVPVYFDSIARKNPFDPASPIIGSGRFHIEIYYANFLGFDVQSMTSAGLMTTRFVFDGIFPFLILFVISFFTEKTEKARLDKFYAKMKTPVAATPETDEMELAASYENPNRFNHLKLFPNSNWEFCKWTKTDTIGFLLCWVAVAFILAFLWLVLNIGK